MRLWAEDQCRQKSMSELLASGMTHAEVFKLCNDVCPISKAVDVRTRCDAHHTFHSLQYTFTEAQKYHPQMQWHILFISFMLLLGAIIRMTVPKWIPYTVFILICICFFIISIIIFIHKPSINNTVIVYISFFCI